MERRFKYAVIRNSTAAYGCETTGLLTGAPIVWHSVSMQCIVLKCRADLNIQQSILA